MNIVRIQGEAEKRRGVYYEFDVDGPALGEGGMGRIYKGFCVDMRTGQRHIVAIKAVHESIHSPQLLERARREASIQIDNENLMKMYGFIENREQLLNGACVMRYYMPMELLVGVNLSDLLRGVVTDQNGLRIPFADELYGSFQNDKVTTIAQIVKSILAGIMALHNKGFIHRDVDPSNVMITLDRKIKLIDFGVCKQINTLATTDKHLTSSGTFIGKVNYAAPELVLGDVKSQNETTDIYAIGVLAYELYTGRLPFDGSDEQVLHSHLRKPMPLRDIKDPHLRKIIKKATEKSQAKRYASAAEMIVDLERLLSKTHTGGTVLVKQSDRRPKLIIGGVTGAVAAVLAAVLLCLDHKPGPIVLPSPTVSELYAQAIGKITPGQTDSLILQGWNEIYRLAKDSLHAPSIMLHYDHVISEKDTIGWREAYAMVEELAVRDTSTAVMFQCAMVNTYFPKISTPEKERYAFINECYPEAAIMWLEKIIEKDPKDHRAIFYVLINYIKLNNPDVYKEQMEQYYQDYIMLTKDLPEEEVDKYEELFNYVSGLMTSWGLR